MLKRVLGIDVETTGLNTDTDRITEVGAVLWDTEDKKPLYIMNFMCKFSDGPEVSEEITRITGITEGMLSEFGVANNAEAFTDLLGLMVKADAVVAHNAPFDSGMLYKAFELLGIGLPVDLLWVDTAVDVPYPEALTVRKLTYLAAEHNFLNPFAHRAVFDVLTMLRVLSCYDIATVELYANTPNVTLIADTAKPWEDKAPEGEKEKDKAKARGYRWDDAGKTWSKQVKQFQAEAELEACKGEFKVRVVACQS